RAGSAKRTPLLTGTSSISLPFSFDARARAHQEAVRAHDFARSERVRVWFRCALVVPQFVVVVVPHGVAGMDAIRAPCSAYAVPLGTERVTRGHESSKSISCTV